VNENRRLFSFWFVTMNKSIINWVMSLALSLGSLVASTPVKSQGLSKLSVPLTINEKESGFANFAINLDQKLSDAMRLGKAPGDVLISAERLSEPANTYRLRVDTDGDGNLANETPVLLQPNSSVVVRVMRRWANGEKRELPYTIEYSREPDRNNNIRERLSWSPHYRAEGRLKVGKCESLLVAVDINGDALFDEYDFAKGTTIGLDRNGDGRVSGEDEWLRGNQLIEYCGTAFFITSIAINGSNIALAETSLRVPRLGAGLPEFSLETTSGKTMRLSELRGKLHLLDFWASWCKPCVEKFSLVKKLDAELGDSLAIVAINVDEASRVSLAREIINTYQLKWPEVMTGRGEADPLWKTFGSMEGNRLAIPLYVLVDSKGVLRYAGNGGEDLSELRQKIEDARKAN
jgi:thiol-disulfide isomerase/thioredoxin